MMNVNKLMGYDTIHKGTLETSTNNVNEATKKEKNASKTAEAEINVKEPGKGNIFDIKA